MIKRLVRAYYSNKYNDIASALGEEASRLHSEAQDDRADAEDIRYQIEKSLMNVRNRLLTGKSIKI
jgi:hypothetical protein